MHSRTSPVLRTPPWPATRSRHCHCNRRQERSSSRRGCCVLVEQGAIHTSGLGQLVLLRPGDAGTHKRPPKQPTELRKKKRARDQIRSSCSASGSPAGWSTSTTRPSAALGTGRASLPSGEAGISLARKRSRTRGPQHSSGLEPIRPLAVKASGLTDALGAEEAPDRGDGPAI